MPLLDIITKGATDVGLTLRMADSGDGTPETGVTSATGGLDVWYRRQGAAKTSLTESDLSALTDAHSDGGLLHISDGEYRVDFPDAAFATGVDWVDVGWGATGMVGFGGRIRLISVTRGLTGTAVPDAAAGAANGLPTDSTGKTSFNDIAATAIVSSGAITTSGGAVSTVTTTTTATNLTNAPTNGDLTATMKTSVETAVNAQLEVNHLDHLFKTTYDPASKPGAADALLNELIENDGGVSRYTANALEQAPSGGAADPFLIASGTIGATGNDTTHLHLDGLTQGDDELNDLLIVVTDVSASEVHSRWIADWVLSTELATVVTLPFTPEASVDTYAILAVRQDVTGGSGLDAAGVRAAIGLAAANLDTQLADKPTVAAFEARTLVAANYFDPAADSVTVGTNNDKTGYSLTATTGLGNQTANITGNLSGSVGSVTGAVGSVTGNVGGNVAGSVGSVTGAVGSVTGNVGGNVVGSVASVAGNVDGSVASVTGAVGSVTGNVGGNVTGTVGGVAGTITTLDALDAAQDSQHSTTQAAITAVQADLPQRITKNTALAGFEFLMVDAADHVTGKTGLTVTATRSLDGAAFGACANAVSEVSNGIYKIDLAAADLNANTVTLRFAATGADDTFISLVTQTT